MGKITFHNSEYDINDGLLDVYEKVVGKITEENLDDLWKYHSVYEERNIQRELFRLMESEVFNRTLLWKTGLGGIVEYNANGKIQNIFRSVDEMILAEYGTCSIYGFEFYDGLKEGLTRNGIAFFGVKFKPLYDQMSWKNMHITFLNIAMRFLRRWEKSQALKSYENPYFKAIIGDISFDEYCEQYRKSFIFTLVQWFYFTRKSMHEIAERVKMDEKRYKADLEKLLNGYVVNGITKFEKVNDLGVYTGCSGIYILCLDEIRGYYVGQTSTDIKQRIKNHWSEPSNKFDRSYGPNDVSAIYVLRLKPEYLNRVEQDCIASINPIYLFNSFVGGNAIAGVHHAQYNSEKYKMKQDELSEILTYLKNQK